MGTSDPISLLKCKVISVIFLGMTLRTATFLRVMAELWTIFTQGGWQNASVEMSEYRPSLVYNEDCGKLIHFEHNFKKYSLIN